MAKNGKDKEATKEAQQALQDHKETLKNVGTWKNLKFEDLNHIRNAVLDAWDQKLKQKHLSVVTVAAAHAKEADRAIKNLKENPKFDKETDKQNKAEQAIEALIGKPPEDTPVLEKTEFWKQLDPQFYYKIKNAIVGAEADIKEKSKTQDLKMNLHYARKFCADGGDPEELIERIRNISSSDEEDNPDNGETQSNSEGNEGKGTN